MLGTAMEGATLLENQSVAPWDSPNACSGPCSEYQMGLSSTAEEMGFGIAMEGRCDTRLRRFFYLAAREAGWWASAGPRRLVMWVGQRRVVDIDVLVISRLCNAERNACHGVKKIIPAAAGTGAFPWAPT